MQSKKGSHVIIHGSVAILPFLTAKKPFVVDLKFIEFLLKYYCSMKLFHREPNAVMNRFSLQTLKIDFIFV